MELLIFVFTFLFGLAVGAFAGYIANNRKQYAFLEMKSKLEAAETLLHETKQTAEAKEKTIETLRVEKENIRNEKAVSDTRVEEAAKKIEEQRKLLDEARIKMTETFQAISGEALKSNNKAFLDLARESLEVILSETRGEMDKKEESIKNVVKPLEEALKRYEKQIGEMEISRATAYGNLDNQIRSLMDSQRTLQKETGNLVTALRRPEIRGRWGEVTLKRVAELAGMMAYCDYTEQVSVSSEEGRLRPDMLVHLPAGREIVVDSKVSLDAYLDAISADTDEKKNEILLRHAQHIRKHMNDLSGKAYWEQFKLAPEFVVMFIPGESFLSAAVEKDPTIIEDGMAAKVIIATPTTLIALLRAVAYGWRQEQLAKNAQEIATIGKELYDRFEPFLEHISKTGSNLSQAVVSFNKMVMSLERRVMVSVRKFKDLGVVGDKELPEIKQIEQSAMDVRDTDR
ncbi:MAG TPA: DNA recombination protein RmuC [Candidatus Omnitrophota bacterium]|nr:DNA recombination protein RmuC [Candidatus Omnitrophota bacterium]HPS19660.1 DNA recombination protein RmuC [Candidatus Omnitrophota bacterium]